MSKLHKLESVVKKVLEEHEPSRGSDDLLVLLVYQEIRKDIGNMSYEMVMKNRKFLKLPAMESVTRCRRKIQESNFNLLDPVAQKARHEAEQIYVEYARVETQKA